ncbi:MAG: redoxin domain-containing protein [Chloroflexota bacterium]
MSKYKSKRHSRKSNSPALAVLGAGLVLLGAAAWMLWPRQASGEADPASSASLTEPVAVNYPAPELTLSDVSGEQHSLAGYRGQVVLVNLWATWCPPCKAEMPTLNDYYKDHADEGFMILAVNDGDPAGDVSAFAQAYGLSFPVLLDPNYIATDQAFKTRSLPSSFVIDREGVVRLRWVGEIDRATLEEYVTPLVAQ